MTIRHQGQQYRPRMAFLPKVSVVRSPGPWEVGRDPTLGSVRGDAGRLGACGQEWRASLAVRQCCCWCYLMTYLQYVCFLKIIIIRFSCHLFIVENRSQRRWSAGGSKQPVTRERGWQKAVLRSLSDGRLPPDIVIRHSMLK